MNIDMYHIVFRRLRLFYARNISENSPFYNDTEIWFRPVRVTFSAACTHLLYPNAAPLFRPARGGDAPALRLSSLYSRFVVPAALWQPAALNTKRLCVAGSYIHWLAYQLAVNRSSIAHTLSAQTDFAVCDKWRHWSELFDVISRAAWTVTSCQQRCVWRHHILIRKWDHTSRALCW